MEVSNSQNIDESSVIVKNVLDRRSKWRRYGNLKVFCNGCIIISPVRLWWWLLELHVIIVTTAFIYEHDQYPMMLTIGSLILSLVCLVSCFKTNMMDPGVFPRPNFDEALENAIEVSRMLRLGCHHPSRNVQEGNRTVRHPYCIKCHHFRPPLSGHCTTCDCCIELWDHHCPIFGGCVGKNNLRAFHVMTFSMSFVWAFFLIASLYSVIAGGTQKRGAVEFISSSLTLMLVLGGILFAIILPPILKQFKCFEEPEEDYVTPLNWWSWAQNPTSRSETQVQSTNNKSKNAPPVEDKTSSQETDFQSDKNANRIAV